MAPDDIIDGPDPAFSFHTEERTVHVCTCGYATLNPDNNHLLFAHGAVRNPEITCQAAPPWDHERWCVRPKDHEGDHWTPSFTGGRSWPQRHPRKGA